VEGEGEGENDLENDLENAPEKRELLGALGARLAPAGLLLEASPCCQHSEQAQALTQLSNVGTEPPLEHSPVHAPVPQWTVESLHGLLLPPHSIEHGPSVQNISKPIPQA